MRNSPPSLLDAPPECAALRARVPLTAAAPFGPLILSDRAPRVPFAVRSPRACDHMRQLEIPLTG